MEKTAEFLMEAEKSKDEYDFDLQEKKIDDELTKFEKRWKKYKTTITRNFRDNHPDKAKTLMGSEKPLLDALVRANNAFPLWAEH
jgi:hypothetical protein